MILSDSARPAPFGRLLAAMIYDCLPVLGIWMVTLLLLVIANSGDAVFGALVQTLLFLELYGYFAFSWIRRRRTLGMLSWRLCIDCAGPRVTLNQATYRFIGAGLGIACFGLGYLWRWIDVEQRTWADLFSSTRIYHDPEYKGHSTEN
ncbi:MAG: RDD family protein [Pseudomonadales bacterium]